uniref:Uncharacterized protein n=1 Tax=Arundo donax TaxID=35708 RepID=A0A0A9HRT1_ARUDO
MNKFSFALNLGWRKCETNVRYNPKIK